MKIKLKSFCDFPLFKFQLICIWNYSIAGVVDGDEKLNEINWNAPEIESENLFETQ